jgi:2-C-methyl-D-erythritol 2,4-cyclodiphosphate synthase
MTNLRIGQGYDVHRLTEGRDLILGGVRIPWERGLEGHSDADVLTHAVMDALLGAAGLGDIGELFPDSDAHLAGISSLELLRQVGKLLLQNGFSVVNLDATLVAQAPKIAPYKRRMEQTIAQSLAISPKQVSVKATTEERLGFTGNGAGMAAQAVALLEKMAEQK